MVETLLNLHENEVRQAVRSVSALINIVKSLLRRYWSTIKVAYTPKKQARSHGGAFGGSAPQTVLRPE